MSTSAEPHIRLEQRQQKRVSTLKKGRIVFNNGHCAVDCTVRNISDIGAGLQLPGYVDLPAMFTLIIKGGAERECAVVWSANDKLGMHYGVRYIDACQAPQTESSRHLLLRRIGSIQDQLDELRREIETTLAP